MRISIMRIPQGFKIRKKSDVKVFMEKCMCEGNRYDIVTDSGLQIVFRKDKESNYCVAIRSGDLTDMFNPSLEVARTKKIYYKETVEEYIWQNRKYINAKWFVERR